MNGAVRCLPYYSYIVTFHGLSLFITSQLKKGSLNARIIRWVVFYYK